MRFRVIALVLTSGLGLSAHAQDASGVGTVMAACQPIMADGATIRTDLSSAGWVTQDTQSGAGDLRDLVGSQMWAFMNTAPSSDHLSEVDAFVSALTASLNDLEFGQIYTHDGQVAVVLSQGENISCFWIGPDDDIFRNQVETIGGFPGPADGPSPVTARKDQTVEFAGRDWRRVESYASLSEETRAGPYPAAALLGRSPAQ